MNKKIKLNLGCGKHILKKPYINVDLYENADFKDDISKLPSIIYNYGFDSIDEIYSAHSLMCVPENKMLDTLKLWYMLLKKGGVLIIETTDLDRQIYEFINGNEKKAIHSLFGDNIQDGLGIRYQFNYSLLNYWLTEAGFRNIEKTKQLEYSKHNEEYNLCVKAIK